MYLNRRVLKYCGISIFVILLFIVTYKCFNTLLYSFPDYDSNYNGTVAMNVYKYGEYRTSYSESIIFNNLITTGETVILPTAFLYSLFGVSNVTTCLMPFLYSIALLIMSYVVLLLAFSKSRYKYILCALVLFVVVISDMNFWSCSTYLYGESCAIFFSLIVLFFMLLFCKKKKNLYLWFSGVFLAFVLITKTSSIFIVVSYFICFFIECFILKNIRISQFVYFIFGFIFGFIFVQLYRIFQLGGVIELCLWWKNEFQNMLTQSSGLNTKLNIIEKIKYLYNIFSMNYYFSLFITFLPSILYIYEIIIKITNKKNILKINKSFLIIGIAGSSLIIYFIFFGGEGLFAPRRHSINEYIIKLFAIYMFIYVLSYIYNKVFIKRHTFLWNKHISKVLISFIFIIFFVFSVLFYNKSLFSNASKLFTYSNCYSYEYILQNQFLTEVKKYNNNHLYTYSWWQEPSVTLYLDYPMIDITKNDTVIDKNEGIFIVGRRFDSCTIKNIENYYDIRLTKISNIDVDYNILNSFNSQELFSIYKIS